MICHQLQALTHLKHLLLLLDIQVVELAVLRDVEGRLYWMGEAVVGMDRDVVFKGLHLHWMFLGEFLVEFHVELCEGVLQLLLLFASEDWLYEVVEMFT